MSNARFELYATNIGLCRWRFKKPNGQIVMSSRLYTRKAVALHGIQVARATVASAIIVDLTLAEEP